MATLTISSLGQITLGPDLLEHLNVGPGDKVTVEKLPDGSITLRAASPKQSPEDAAQTGQPAM